MTISIVVAVARNGVIGREGGLAWRISDDLKWFKRVTLGKPVVMGRKTYDSIGKALPGRRNLVVTGNPRFAAPAVESCASVEDALSRAADAPEICIIGGAAIYAQTLGRADRIYFTEVDAAPLGDVHFPAFDRTGWSASAAGSAGQGPRNDHSCRFFIFDRAK